jgi:hypothetical protein
MERRTALGDELEKVVNTRAAQLEAMGLKALVQNGQNPEKAKGTLFKLMRDNPRVLEELFGGEDVVRNKGYQYLCGLKRRHDEATEAASREEARVGQRGFADKAVSPMPAAPRLNDGDGGQSGLARKSHPPVAASPSPSGDGKGHARRAGDGQEGLARPSPPFGDDVSQRRYVGNDHTPPAPSSPSKPTADAGLTAGAGHGHARPAGAAVGKPTTLPVRTERISAHGQKNETPAAVAAKMRMMERRSEVLLPTFQVFDGNHNRDIAEVYGHEMAGIHKRNVDVLKRKGDDLRKHLVTTISLREIWARVGNARKRADEVLPRTEIVSIRNRVDLQVAAMSEVVLENTATELRKMERGDDSALPLFQETLKLIGGTANAT